jgi:hypothetical protein
VDDVISKWNKNYNLIELVIKNLEKYLSEFQKYYNSGKFPNDKKLNYQNYVNLNLLDLRKKYLIYNFKAFDGKYSYRENLETRLNFVTNISINSNKKNELNLEHMKKMWGCFIKNKLSNFEQTIFISWLLREKPEKDPKNQTKKNYFLPDNLINDIFNKIFIDPNFVEVPSMTFDVFKCFQSFFEYINVQQKNMEMNHRNQFRILKFNSIFGKDYFWHILLYNSNEQV